MSESGEKKRRACFERAAFFFFFFSAHRLILHVVGVVTSSKLGPQSPFAREAPPCGYTPRFTSLGLQRKRRRGTLSNSKLQLQIERQHFGV